MRRRILVLMAMVMSLLLGLGADCDNKRTPSDAPECTIPNASCGPGTYCVFAQGTQGANHCVPCPKDSAEQNAQVSAFPVCSSDSDCRFGNVCRNYTSIGLGRRCSSDMSACPAITKDPCLAPTSCGSCEAIGCKWCGAISPYAACMSSCTSGLTQKACTTSCQDITSCSLCKSNPDCDWCAGTPATCKVSGGCASPISSCSTCADVTASGCDKCKSYGCDWCNGQPKCAEQGSCGSLGAATQCPVNVNCGAQNNCTACNGTGGCVWCSSNVCVATGNCVTPAPNCGGCAAQVTCAGCQSAGCKWCAGTPNSCAASCTNEITACTTKNPEVVFTSAYPLDQLFEVGSTVYARSVNESGLRAVDKGAPGANPRLVLSKDADAASYNIDLWAPMGTMALYNEKLSGRIMTLPLDGTGFAKEVLNGVYNGQAVWSDGASGTSYFVVGKCTSGNELYVTQPLLGTPAKVTASQPPGACWVRSDANDVFFAYNVAGNRRVVKVPKASPSTAPTDVIPTSELAAGTDTVSYLALSSTEVYAATASGKLLRSLKKGGGGTVYSVLSAATLVKPGFVTDATHLYFGTEVGADIVINRVALGSTGTAPEAVTKHAKTSNPVAIYLAVDATHVYWINEGTIYRVAKN